MFEEQLENSVVLTGEEMLFQSLSKRSLDEKSSYYLATITVTSPADFVLLVGIPDASTKVISEVLYGDPSLSESPGALRDVVAELANTIAGTLARSLSDDSNVEISPPSSGHGKLPLPMSTCLGFSGDDIEIVVAAMPRHGAELGS